MKVKVLSETFFFHPSKALVWPNQSLLCIADIHLGKAETFQRHGYALSSEIQQTDLTILAELIHNLDIHHLLFLGDFIHSPTGVTREVIKDFAKLKERFQGRVTVVIGNHDLPFINDWPSEWGFAELTDRWSKGNFHFQHEPPDPKSVNKGEFVWCGHLHPRVKLSRGADQLKLPAFAVGPKIGYLPAFTSLAAGMDIHKTDKFRYFPTTGSEVFELA